MIISVSLLKTSVSSCESGVQFGLFWSVVARFRISGHNHQTFISIDQLLLVVVITAIRVAVINRLVN